MHVQRNPQFRTRSALPSVALAMLLSAGASVALADNLVPKTAGQISYVCGGVAQDEQEALNAEARTTTCPCSSRKGRAVNTSPMSTSSSRGTARKSPASALTDRAA